jgi:hypothetical protein
MVGSARRGPRCALLLLAACRQVAGLSDPLTSDGRLPGSGPCGATVLLSDPFDTGDLSTYWTTTQATDLPVSETAGDLEIDFASTVSGGDFSYVRSIGPIAVDGLCAVVEIDSVPNLQGSNPIAYVKLRTDFEEVGWQEQFATLTVRNYVSSSHNSLASLTWDPVADRFVRLRHDTTTTYWETSPDGSTFTTVWSLPGFTVGTAQLEIGAGAQANVTNGGRARFASALATGP